jgi:hypothetical protein
MAEPELIGAGNTGGTSLGADLTVSGGLRELYLGRVAVAVAGLDIILFLSFRAGWTEKRSARSGSLGHRISNTFSPG